MQQDQRITEIICLSSKTPNGRPRVLKPGDFTDGSMWERQVQMAIANPERYEIHREVTYSEEQKVVDYSKVELREMTSMSRERVAQIAESYGITDEGQGRGSLIEQIASEREKVQKVLGKAKPLVPDSNPDSDPENPDLLSSVVEDVVPKRFIKK